MNPPYIRHGPFPGNLPILLYPSVFDLTSNTLCTGGVMSIIWLGE